MQISASLTPSTRIVPAREHYWDWYSVVIVFLLGQVAAARLLITGWIPDLSFAGTLALLGVVLGLAFGYSNFRREAILVLALLYSITIVPLKLLSAIQVDAALQERLASLGGRLWVSVGNLIARKPIEDPLFFLAFTSFVFWLAAVQAGYSLTRDQNLLAIILPYGIITLTIHNFDDYVPARGWAVAIYLFLSLILLGRLSFAKNRAGWKLRHVITTPDTAPDVQNILWLSAGLIVLLAWLIPSSINNVGTLGNSWDQFFRPVRERFSPAVSALESPFGSGTGDEFYSKNLVMGRSAALGEMPMFTVNLNSSLSNPPPRFYWRGRVYDTYLAGVWENKDANSQPYDPEMQELVIPGQAGRTRIRLTVSVEISRQALIYTPGDPVWVNRPGTIFASAATMPAWDLSAWLAKPVLQAGDRYEVQTELANPSVEELRLAGTAYPDWITARYLQIPEAMRAQLTDLGQSISPNPSATPYDQASAITGYLRREIEYSTELPPLPADMDPVMWVLLEHKKGFCMYDASAEVLLLRALGVPARLAVGFAQGELVRGEYHVLRDDSHAWPEVYFPGIGWVEFEPTAIQAPLTRPISARAAEQPQTDLTGLPNGPLQQPIKSLGEEQAERALAESGATNVNFFTTIPGYLLISAIFIFLVVIAFYLNKRHQVFLRAPLFLNRVWSRSGSRPPRWLRLWINWNTLSSIERSFQAINLSLAWLGSSIPINITPAERARKLIILLPDNRSEIELLVHEHQLALYAQGSADLVRARKAGWVILMETLKRKFRR